MEQRAPTYRQAGAGPGGAGRGCILICADFCTWFSRWITVMVSAVFHVERLKGTRIPIAIGTVWTDLNGFCCVSSMTMWELIVSRGTCTTYFIEAACVLFGYGEEHQPLR